jgi:hypothetical protein
MSKGSTPRPYSVSQKQFADNWDAIFKKGKDMQVRVNEKTGRCGCGRSPTGRCIGWHGLTEDEYRIKLKEYHEFDEKVIMKNELYDIDKDK